MFVAPRTSRRCRIHDDECVHPARGGTWADIAKAEGARDRAPAISVPTAPPASTSGTGSAWSSRTGLAGRSCAARPAGSAPAPLVASGGCARTLSASSSFCS
jgi:hypothetical protein